MERAHTHTYVARVAWSASSGLLGIAGFYLSASIVLMGFLSGTPALICIQPCAAHPRNSFLGKCIMIRLERSTTVAQVRVDVLRKLSEGRKRDSRATPYIRFCQITYFPWNRIKHIFVGFIFADLPFNVVSIDSYVEFIIFQRKIPRTSVDMQHLASVWKKIFNFNISYHALDTMREILRVDGEKTRRAFHTITRNGSTSRIIILHQAEQYYSILAELRYDLWENTITRRTIIFLVNRSS